MTQGERVNAVNEWNDKHPYPRFPLDGGSRDRGETYPGFGTHRVVRESNVKVVDGKRAFATPLTPTQWKITQVIDEIEQLLISKNNAYGNSFAHPIGVFSKVDALAQLDVRIDDKLNRIKKGSEYPGDDTELDLIGYLILKRVLRAL